MRYTNLSGIIYTGHDKLLPLERTWNNNLEKLTDCHKLTKVVREKAEFHIFACSSCCILFTGLNGQFGLHWLLEEALQRERKTLVSDLHFQSWALIMEYQKIEISRYNKIIFYCF